MNIIAILISVLGAGIITWTLITTVLMAYTFLFEYISYKKYRMDLKRFLISLDYHNGKIYDNEFEEIGWYGNRETLDILYTEKSGVIRRLGYEEIFKEIDKRIGLF